MTKTASTPDKHCNQCTHPHPVNGQINGPAKTGKKGKPRKGKGNKKGKGDKAYKNNKTWQQPRQGKGDKNKNALVSSLADRLATQTGTTRAALLQEWNNNRPKGQGKLTKGKGQGKTGKNGKPTKGKRQCVDWLAGTCTRGDACWFSHE